MKLTSIYSLLFVRTKDSVIHKQIKYKGLPYQASDQRRELYFDQLQALSDEFVHQHRSNILWYSVHYPFLHSLFLFWSIWLQHCSPFVVQFQGELDQEYRFRCQLNGWIQKFKYLKLSTVSFFNLKLFTKTNKVRINEIDKVREEEWM